MKDYCLVYPLKMALITVTELTILILNLYNFTVSTQVLLSVEINYATFFKISNI